MHLVICKGRTYPPPPEEVKGDGDPTKNRKSAMWVLELGENRLNMCCVEPLSASTVVLL